ncbi:MAG TPA: winged helix-turn-helix domain-containing protein [Bryobacteraceae bacterium]|nr:winged helix-turn-helix domain-containing protein [Bryobacteraceae bacterium]
MGTQPVNNSVASFGPFQLDYVNGELRRHGVRVRLARQPWQVLAMLAERPGEVVSKEEIRQLLWSADTFVDFEHGLNATINRLRQALGDTADNPRYIQTIPGRGYRFLGQVHTASTTPSAPVASAPVRVEDTAPAAPPVAERRHRVPWILLL